MGSFARATLNPVWIQYWSLEVKDFTLFLAPLTCQPAVLILWSSVRRHLSSFRRRRRRPASTIHIFDFSETVSQINFKLDGDVSWVGLYHVCSNGRGPVIFYFFIGLTSCEEREGLLTKGES